MLHPVVLRQRFGQDLQITQTNKYHVTRYTCGSDSGSSSVGMDP